MILAEVASLLRSGIQLQAVRISRGLPWPSWPESTANNHKVPGSSLRNASMLLIETQNPSCLSRGSHSSAGQSVRPITVRSAFQARVGPCTLCVHRCSSGAGWCREAEHRRMVCRSDTCFTRRKPGFESPRPAKPLIITCAFSSTRMMVGRPNSALKPEAARPKSSLGLIAQLVRAYGQ